MDRPTLFGERRILDTCGKRIRLLRIDAGMNQGDVCEALKKRYNIGFAQSYLSDVENSDKIPGGDVIAGLSKLFDVSADYLLLLTDSMRPEAAQMVEVGISPEAEEVAEIVDRLQPSYRQDVLRFARLTLETQPKPASVSAADAQYTRSLLNTLRRHGGDELAKQVLREFVLQHPALLRELGGLLDGPLGGVELGNQRTNTKYSAG